jgi:hypothetical protein
MKKEKPSLAEKKVLDRQKKSWIRLSKITVDLGRKTNSVELVKKWR